MNNKHISMISKTARVVLAGAFQVTLFGLQFTFADSVSSIYFIKKYVFKECKENGVHNCCFKRAQTVTARHGASKLA